MRLSTGAAVTEPFDDLDRLSPEALDRWWARRLRAVLITASKELPFYTGRFSSAGFEPASFRKLDDLRAVPISTKADLLAAQSQYQSHKLGIEREENFASRSRTTLSLSSGTSGTTFITHTARWRRVQGESSCRAHWWAGLRRGTPLLMSAPAWHSYAAIQPYIAQRFGMQCIVISGTYLPRFADRIVDAILRFRPRFVTMFLPMVFSVLATAQAQGLSGDELFSGIESLVVTGAPVTPGMRRHLRDLTRVLRVAEIAGSSENLLAVDCAYAQGLHVVPDTCYVEVLDRNSRQPAKDGERGCVVHSSVIAAGSMYLRYDGGDVGVIDRSPCPCGLPSPRIKLLGRWEDCIPIGGRTLLPYDVQYALEEEVPELCGAPCVISREGLGAGVLRLMVIEPERSGAAVLDKARMELSRRFGLPVDIAAMRNLPLRFKGVPPILSESEAKAAQ